ncbi:hypothetical protein MPUL_00140 [Mycolicibacterium pulveris]|uniref:Capsid maturation protease and MuF-like fusion protein n=1 Tax=Mycolicibacterium pulveris TaxID=36813 RepID=A0A7I7UFB3_MYCPV|nr:hypothetical protein [Mycolicibacterium pulveris]BBY78856.1 hypothetical protein MPUL_00140 [Mycolicibacterium pulveris]
MWPRQGEALSRTIEAEAAIADLYAEALRRWAPAARAAVLPSLTAAATELPPNPEGLGQAQSAWDEHAEQIILAGVAVLWAAAAYEAATGLGTVPAAAAAAVTPQVSTVVLGIVLASLLMPREEVLEAVAFVDADPALRVARDEYIAAKRAQVAATPQLVQAKLEKTLADMTMTVEHTTTLDDGAEPQITVEVVPETRPEVLRNEAELVLEPTSEQMAEIVRQQGYQAAGVMNHAVLAAAKQSEDADELEAVWLATLDGKTRPTHWAAWGQRVPLGTAFTVGGEQLRYPGDPAGSAKETSNCRCRLGILARDEPLPDEFDLHTERLDGRDSVAIHREGRTQAEEIERRRAQGNVRARDTADGAGRFASTAPAGMEQESSDMTKPSDLAAKRAANAEKSAQVSEGILPTTTQVSEEMAAAEFKAEETFRTFTDAVFAVLGTPTSDRRMLAADMDLKFRNFPLPLQWCERSKGGHDDSVTIGVVEDGRVVDGMVLGSGYLLNNEHADKAFDLMTHGVANPSVDLGGELEVVETYEDGTAVTDQNFDAQRPVYTTVTRGEVLATTIVAIPAFGETRITLNAEREPRDRALVASAAEKFQPRVYDPELFSDPQLAGPTPLSIDLESGRIYGHVAVFSEKHRSVGLGHISPPRSRSGYAHFHSSPPVYLSDGTRLPVGRLTVGIGHAPTTGVSNAAAQAHYDNAEACFALVRAGEDRHGIWVSGVAAPWATPEKIEMGLSAPLSGDWRPYNGDLELVAVLAVNTPGFLCRASTDGQGNPLAMVASMSPRSVDHVSAPQVTLADIKAVVAEALEESTRSRELKARRAAALERARAAVGDPPPPMTPTERVYALLAERVDDFADVSRMPAQLKAYWLKGPGAAKIGWGTKGSFNRCVAAINAEIVEDGRKPLPDRQIKGLCANLYREATGMNPGRH